MYQRLRETRSTNKDSRGLSFFVIPGVLLCTDRQSSAARQIGVCRFASKFPVIARPVRRLVVAIPRLEVKCTEKYHE